MVAEAWVLGPGDAQGGREERGKDGVCLACVACDASLLDEGAVGIKYCKACLDLHSRIGDFKFRRIDSRVGRCESKSPSLDLSSGSGRFALTVRDACLVMVGSQYPGWNQVLWT
jgi:hypothetical protein